MNRRLESSIVTPGASPEEAAAVIAAIERFRRDTAPAPVADTERRSPWLEASLREGVARQPGLLPTWI